MLEKETTLLEGAKKSLIAESKCKEVAAGDKEVQWPSKKAKEKQPEKYHRSAAVKIGGANPYERYMSAGQDCLVYPSK